MGHLPQSIMSSCAFDTLTGAVISLVTCRVTSWFIADRYFKRQREIEKEKENQEVQHAFSKLMHSYFQMFRKRPKASSPIHLAMAEFEARLRIYKSDYDANEMMKEAAEQAEHFIDEHKNDFEDI